MRFWQHGLFVALLVISSAPQVIVARENYWVDPPPAGPNAGTGFENNTLVREGSKRTIKWHTEFPKSIVLLCQEYQHGSPASLHITPSFTRENETEWVVDASSFSLDVSPVFYVALWALFENGTKDDSAEVRTDYFNITSELANASAAPDNTRLVLSTTFSRQSSTSQTTTTTTVSSTSSTTSTTQSGTSMSTPSSKSGTSSHISTGAAVGIGIASAVAIIAAATTLLWSLRKNKQEQLAQTSSPPVHASSGDSGDHILSGGSEMYEAYVLPGEMPTESDHHELDTRGRSYNWFQRSGNEADNSIYSS